MTATGDSISGAAFDHGNNPPMAIVLRTTSQSIPNSSATAVTFDSEEFDNAAWFTPSSTTITVPEDGVVTVAGTFTYATNVTGTRGIQVQKNASGVDGVYVPATSSTTNLPVAYANSFLCVAGDTFTFNAFQSSGGALNLIAARITFKRDSGT